MALPETMKAICNFREGNSLTYGVRDVPTPKVSDPNDIIIKMEAAPINPSDLGRLAMVGRMVDKDPAKLEAGSTPGTVKVTLPEQAQGMLPDGVPMIVGNEGCGTVVAAGDGADAQALLGKRVALSVGSCYAQYAKHTIGNDPKLQFAKLPDDVSAIEGASVFVNPLTVVGFLHTMQEAGHKAIVHTAAGSQLGRMLIKYCKSLNVPLVNIVRKEEVAKSLRDLGAEYVINSSVDSYKDDLLAAIKATGATIGFDATGGGDLASDILHAMEAMLREKEGGEAGWYGPSTFRQVYRYGGLNSSNTTMPMSLGVGNWAYGGWLMPFHFNKYGPEHMQKSIQIAVSDLKDTFSSSYGKHLTLEGMAASPEEYIATLTSTTDKKFLVTPNGEVQ